MTSDLGDRERRTLSNPRIPDLRDPVTKRSNNNKKRTNKETKDKQKNITKKNGVRSIAIVNLMGTRILQ